MGGKLTGKQMLVGGVILVAAGAGMGWTYVKDYRPWWHAENDNFGHGPGELRVVEEANKLWQNQTAGVRLNYPGEWEVVETGWGKRGVVTDTVVKLERKEPEVTLTVKLGKKTATLADIADNLVAKNLKAGWVAEGEREYTSNGKISITLLTWKVGEEMVQQAVTADGEKLVTMEARAEFGVGQEYRGTWKKIYESLVTF